MTERAKVLLVILLIMIVGTSFMYIKGMGAWGPVVSLGSCHKLGNFPFIFKFSEYNRKKRMYKLNLLHSKFGYIMKSKFITTNEEGMLNYFTEIDCPKIIDKDSISALNNE